MRPVVQLSATMKNVKNGDLDITVHTREKGEVGELYDSFNYMIQMINQLIEENYVTRLNQKQSELNALQEPDQHPLFVQESRSVTPSTGWPRTTMWNRSPSW